MEQEEIKKRIDFWNEIQDEFKIEIFAGGGYRLVDHTYAKVKDFKVCSDEVIFKIMFDEIIEMGKRRENYRIRSMFDEVRQIQNGWSETR